MHSTPTLPLRIELLNVLDQQIEMLTTKSLATFTNDEMGTFKHREQRIRELQLQLANAGDQAASGRGVLSAGYR